MQYGAFNDFQKGKLTWERYCQLLGDYLGGINPGEAAQVHNAILRTAYPGVAEIISDLKRAGIRTGCLSNTNAPHWHTFFSEPRLSMLRSIDFPIASHLIGAEKPDVAMYRAFEEASEAGLGEIVYFDDGLANVSSAREIGWMAFHVDPNGDPAAQMRSYLKEMGWL